MLTSPACTTWRRAPQRLCAVSPKETLLERLLTSSKSAPLPWLRPLPPPPSQRRSDDEFSETTSDALRNDARPLRTAVGTVAPSQEEEEAEEEEAAPVALLLNGALDGSEAAAELAVLAGRSNVS